MFVFDSDIFDQIVMFSNLNVGHLTLDQLTLGQHNVAKTIYNKSKRLSRFLSHYSLLFNQVPSILIFALCLLLQPNLNTFSSLALILNFCFFKVTAAEKLQITEETWGETYVYLKCIAHSKYSPISPKYLLLFFDFLSKNKYSMYICNLFQDS